MAKNNKNRTKKSNKAKVTPAEVGAEYRAPTPGLENMFFGRDKDFPKVLNALAEHVGTGDPPGAQVEGYAMWEINYQHLVKPKMVSHGWLGAEAYEKYQVAADKHNLDVDTWRENGAYIFNRLIQHCDRELHSIL